MNVIILAYKVMLGFELDFIANKAKLDTNEHDSWNWQEHTCVLLVSCVDANILFPSNHLLTYFYYNSGLHIHPQRSCHIQNQKRKVTHTICAIGVSNTSQ